MLKIGTVKWKGSCRKQTIREFGSTEERQKPSRRAVPEEFQALLFDLADQQ